jgi:hypothetical protein
MEVSETDILEVVRMKEKVPTSPTENSARLEARAAIDDILAQYAMLCDAGAKDLGAFDETLEKLCTDDVVKVHGGTLDQRFEGKEAVRESWHDLVLKRKDGRLSKPLERKPGPSRYSAVRHMMTPPVIRISDDGKEAWAVLYFALASSQDTGTGLTRTVHEGDYIFTFVKQGKEWKIKKWVTLSEIGYDPKFFPEELK